MGLVWRVLLFSESEMGKPIPPWNRLDPKAQQPLSPGYGPPGGR